jgi:integral membrane protein (TIGR01906 family)
LTVADQVLPKLHRKRHLSLVILLVVLTALWLIGASFRVVLLGPITSVLAEHTVNDRLSAVDHSRLVEVAETGRAFVVGEKGAALPEGSDYRNSFTPDVVGHMEDVRVVIQGAGILTLILTVLLVAALVIAGRKAGRTAVGLGLLVGGITAFVLVLILALAGSLSFDALFASMHRLFFAEGTWTFAEDSLLICAYPLLFWIGMGVVWGIVLVLLSILSAVTGFLLRRPRTNTPS